MSATPATKPGAKPAHEAAPRKVGRPIKSQDGQYLKARTTRWTDAQWADVLTVGMDWIRETVQREAKRRRAAGSDHPR